jgi:YD repeat-containing protein
MNYTSYKILFFMNRKILVTFFAVIGYYSTAKAQNGMAFPSANNTFLGAAGNIGSSTGLSVDLYTGTAQISIPITSLASKEVTIPVSLNYVGAKGIRVQDYAGSVGLGWQLNAGGSISRVVRCFPDEQPNGYLGTQQWGKVVANNYGGNIFWNPGQFTAITGIPANGGVTGLPTADGEPDIFFIKTPFFNFQFTFDENGEPVFSNTTGIKIIKNNFYNSSNYTNSSFKVIDNNGNQYYFGSSGSSVETSTISLYGGNYTFPTTWYLDKIVTYNAKDVVRFNYGSYFAYDILTHYRSSTTFYNFNSSINNLDNTPVQTTINYPKVITQIISSLGEVNFNYATGRRDNANAVQLSSIVLNAYNPQPQINNTTLKTYSFAYSYFGDPATDPNLLRLRLDQVSVAGNTSQTSSPLVLNSFGYNTAINLPSRTSLSAVDYFGYFTYSANPNPYNISLPPNGNYAKANILTTISDLSGVTNKIFYELNSYYNTTSSSNIDVGGLRVAQISKTLATGENLYTQYKYVDNSNNSTGQILSNSYGIVAFENCNVTKTFSESPSNYYDINGNYIGYSYVKIINQNGGYSTYTFSNFLSPGCNDIINYTGTALVPNITSSISSAYKRGLLLNQANYEATGKIISEDITPLSSYISLTSPVAKKSWAYHWAYVPVIVRTKNFTQGCAYDASSTYWTKVENFRLSQSIHKDYDQNNTNNFIQNSTSYTYLTNSLVPANNNRAIKSITTTNSKGVTVTKTIYCADAPGIPMVTPAEQTAIDAMINANRIGIPVHEVNNNNGSISQTHNTFNTGVLNNNNPFANTYLSATTNYKANTQISQQFYNYNLATSNLSSSNILNGKPTSFLYGYNSSYPIAKVINANSTSTVSGTQPLLQYGGYTNNNAFFTTTAAGDIKLNLGFGGYPGSSSVTAYYTISGPITQSGSFCFSISSQNGCTSNNGSVTIPNMPVGDYNLAVSFSGTNSGVNPYISYYYTIAVPTFSYSNEFFYEGFEQGNGNLLGNAHTGNCYYNATSNPFIVNFTLPNNRNYIIQWWNWVNGKWKFNEQNYTGPSINISGIIDDIRIFPSDAQMNTYSYNPLIGKIAETDASGRSATYEYDGLGRMNITRDNDKNIISKNCYNYIGQIINCNTAAVYTNVAQSGTFTKNNCTAPLVGTSVTYSVAAGLYSSFINQADADQQAANDVNLNGQSYANLNGTCITVILLGNASQSQSFTRNNCPVGNLGGSVTYTVPANTYFASTQTAADAQALADISANGQNYANTNGTCTPAASITGNTSLSFSSSSGSGKIYAPAGYTVKVIINAGGASGYNYSLSVNVTGVTTSGNTSVTNGNTFFTFVMLAAGNVNWSASFSAPNSYGSGSLQVQ